MRIQRRSRSAYIDPEKNYELSIVNGRPEKAVWSGADNPPGKYDSGRCLLLSTESDASGSVLIRDAREDLLEVCIQIIERELNADNPHIKTGDILTEAFKIMRAGK